MTLVFPAGALDDEIEVHISPASTPPTDDGVILARAYEFEPDGAQFDQPVTMTIGYETDLLPGGVVEDDLVLCKAVGSSWQAVTGSMVDVEANTVSAPVTSFSTYAPGDPVGSEGTRITLSPAMITMPTYGSRTFLASVEGLENEAVTWSVLEGLPGGQIFGNGLYNAPAGGGVFHVRATSVADPSVYGDAEVIVAIDWECPEDPPEPTYELVWAVTIPDIFLDEIYGIAWHSGQLWVAGMRCVQHWTDQGQYLGWSGLGAKPNPDGPHYVHTYIGYHTGADDNDTPSSSLVEDGVFSASLSSVACDAVGNVYVSDYGFDRVQILTPGGVFSGKWEMDSPQSIAVSPEHDIYVVDHKPGEPDELRRYNQAGVLVETIDDLGLVQDDIYLDSMHILGFDDHGDLFLAQSTRTNLPGRVVACFDADHAYLGSVLRAGRGPCEARSAAIVDKDGNFYTRSSEHPFPFKKFDKDGWLLATWPSSGPGYEELRGIGGLAVDDYGYVYATDWTNGMILKFRQIGR